MKDIQGNNFLIFRYHTKKCVKVKNQGKGEENSHFSQKKGEKNKKKCFY